MNISQQFVSRTTRSAAVLLAGLSIAAHAADGIWNVDTDGDWSTPSNWQGSTVADGAGSTARFTNDITFPHIVSLDSSRTIGNLHFGDGDLLTAAGWTLSTNGSVPGISLSLSGGTTPVIRVDAINGANGFDSTNDAIVSVTLNSPQGFTKAGAGTLTLTAANTFGTAVTLQEGIVAIGNTAALGGGNRAVTYDGGGIRVWGGGPTFANTNFVLTTGTIVSSNGNYDALNGPWFGSGTVYIRATGRVTPGGGVAHSFLNFNGTIDLADSTTGNETRINLGASQYNMSTVALNTGTNGGRFSFRTSASPTWVRIGALSGGPGTRLMSSEQSTGTSLTWEIGYLNTSTTFEGTLQNRNETAARVGHLTKVGTGTLTLAGPGTYTGNTVISNGVLALAATGTLVNTPSILVVGSTASFDVSAFSPAWNDSVLRTLGGNGTINGSVNKTTGTLSPGVGGIGKLTFAGNLTLDGTGGTLTNQFEIGSTTNDTVAVNGDLTLAGISVVQALPSGPVIPNGTYVLFKWTGTLAGDLTNLTLEHPAQTGTLSLTLDNTAKEIRLQVSGVATAANLTWRGDGLVNAWDLATANWRNGGAASVFSSGDHVLFDNSGSNNLPIDLQIAATPSSLTVGASKDYVIGGLGGGRISGGGGLLKTNIGKLTLTTDNDYLGDTVVLGGTIQVGEGIGTGSLGAGSITNNGTLIFNKGADHTLASPVAGSGVVVQSGFDTLTLSGNNTHSGGTVASNGVLRSSGLTALGSGSVILAGGTFNPQAQVNNPIQLVANGTLQTTAEIPINGLLSGTSGTLSVDATGNGPRFVQGTSFTFSRPIDLVSANARTIAFYNIASTQTYSGVISGSGGIHRRAPSAGFANDAVGGHTVFTGNNTFAGGVTLSEGNVGLGSSSVLDVDGITLISGPLGVGTVTYSPPAALTAPFGYIALYAVGGPRTIANPITFGTVNGDTVQEPFTLDGAFDLTFSGAVTLNQTAFQSGIRVNNSQTIFSGLISGSGGIIKLGSGTLVLSGDNFYTGPTVVSAGTLSVQNTNGSGTGFGAVTVQSGGTLGGTGRIGLASTIEAGGTLAPGASIGTLNFDSDLTIQGNLSIEVNRSLAQSNDVANVAGSLINSGTGTVVVNNLGPALSVGNRFVLFNKAVQNGENLTVTGGGATWINNLATDGSITVQSLVSGTPPLIGTPSIGGGNFNFNGTNGTAGATYHVLSSTNVATPLANWNPVLTNQFGAGGSFSVSIPIAPGEPQKFYLLQVP